MISAHMAYVFAAYGISALVVFGLIFWVILDQRAQKRALADLERRGVRRRSTADNAP